MSNNDTAANFTDSFKDALARDGHLSEAEITRLNDDYNKITGALEQFPTADTLTAEDYPWVRSIELVKSQGLNLQELKDLVKETTGQQTVNIYLPSIDPMSQWMNDTGGFSLVTPDALGSFAKNIPWSSVGDLDTPFTVNPKVLEIITDIMTEKFQVVASHRQGVGPKTDLAFAQGATICLWAGLGTKAVRKLARQLAKTIPAWKALDTDDQTVIIKMLVSAYRNSGYPVSWMRMPWTVVGPLINVRLQWSYAAVIRTVMHILGHARVAMTSRSQPRLILAYDGNYAQIDVDPANLHLPLIQQDKKVLDAVLGTLKISIKVGPNQVKATRAALLAVHLHHLVEVMEASGSGLYLASPSVRFCQDNTVADPILNSRIMVNGVVAIDPVTGVVDQHATVRGSEVMQYDWTPSASPHGEVTKFFEAIPSQVSPIDPATILMESVHNIDYLGYKIGYQALLNAILLVNYLRHARVLSGPLAGVIGNEKPLFAMLANEATAEGATNQGKTTFGRSVGGVMAPGIIVVVFNANPGAPSARAQVDTIILNGTVVWDEFILPDSNNHSLGKEAIQGVATGGALAIGRVRENAPALYPRYSLVLSVKIANWPPDLLNRAFLTFFDPVTPDNSCSPEELRDLMSGKISLTARLSMIRWIEQEHIIERLSTLKLSNTWRFNAVAAVAEMLAGEHKAEVKGYLDASVARAIQLRQQADVSTLAADLGFDQKFSLAALMDQRTPEDMSQLAQLSSAANGLRLGDTILKLYTGCGTLSSINLDAQASLTREYKTTFQTILGLAGRQLAQRPIEMHGYRLRRVLRKDSHGDKVPFVMVEPVASP